MPPQIMGSESYPHLTPACSWKDDSSILDSEGLGNDLEAERVGLGDAIAIDLNGKDGSRLNFDPMSGDVSTDLVSAGKGGCRADSTAEEPGIDGKRVGKSVIEFGPGHHLHTKAVIGLFDHHEAE